MKRTAFIALPLILLALCACSRALPWGAKETEPPAAAVETAAVPGAGTPVPQPGTPAPGQFVFTRENFPRMDGSTSQAPLAQAVASVLLGETLDEVSDLVSFNRTTESYRNLMNGYCDILISAEPAESVWEEYEDAGFGFEKAHIATDALIFVVNADNPVDSLTTEQIRKIYTGEITNWSEVGGENIEIIPFQRNAEAGSQAAMLKHVMKELAMMEPPVEYVVGSMEGLMEAVRNFDGSPGALGYSVYYYANDMRMAEGLKIIAVDGVEPDADTIRAGKYPFLMPTYTLIARFQKEGSSAPVMYEWLQSDEGQALVEAMGYVPVKG